MKYHSLKMEEVNDTMRQLWNKIYQGTGEYGADGCYNHANDLLDIDGIKISSDVEEGATKRSYNYRVSRDATWFPSYLYLLLGGHDQRSS
jgi:DNA repair protein RAD50